MASSDTRPSLLQTPLGQFGLGAVGLIVGGALIFSLIGAVSGPDDGEPVAAQPSTTADAPTATDAPGTTEASDPGSDPATDTDTPTDEAPSTEETTSAPPADPTTDPATTEATEQPPTETTKPLAFEPGSFNVQVLGASEDAADDDAVQGCLSSKGYPLITNRSISRYNNTTVFFTPGGDNEAKARQVAEALGSGIVEPKPRNLSDSVPVHVMTGRDGDTLPC